MVENRLVGRIMFIPFCRNKVRNVVTVVLKWVVTEDRNNKHRDYTVCVFEGET